MSEKSCTLDKPRSGHVPEPLPSKWESIVSHLDFALQPIVSVHDGTCLGFECLLRGHEGAGFNSIHGVFDRAHEERVLHALDLALRKKAIVKFLSYHGYATTKLFYNLDMRVLESPGYSPGATKAILGSLGLSPGSMCFEVSEQQKIFSGSRCGDVLAAYHSQGFAIAIDDYGIGFSGLKRLYECESDYIKIDGFFLSDIATSSRKRLFVSHVVGLAHVLGIKVIAEHVMTEQQFRCSKTAGCDFIQGYLVGEPSMDPTCLQPTSGVVLRLNSEDRRDKRSDRQIVLGQIETVPPLPWDANMAAVLEAFRRNPLSNFIPVANALGEPLGIVREQDIKEFVYSRYGRELMVNPRMKDRLCDFVTKCPIADVNMTLEKMLEIFSYAQGAELLLLTEGSRYRGFLSASALLVALNQRNLAIARDQNPLTRLPGNSLIAEYLGEALCESQSLRVFAYFDLDNFKAFNDVYGFRHGDRAILMLADILKEATHGRDIFLGHIGGDDLFTAFKGPEWSVASVNRWVVEVVGKFNRDVLALISPADRARGHLHASDRAGVQRAIPLLSVSCAILALPAGTASISAETLAGVIAGGKRAAKQSLGKIHLSCVDLSQTLRQYPPNAMVPAVDAAAPL